MGNETRPVGAWRPRTSTTGLLILWMGGLAACVLAMWAVPAADLGAVRNGFGSVGAASGPSAVAAAHLCDDLAEMDGRAATMLLIGDGTGFPQTRSGANQAFDNARADADRQLELLGSGTAAIPGGAGAYVALEDGLNQYSEEIAQAVYVDEQQHAQAPAVPPADALARYQAASALMHRPDTGLLAEAQILLADERGTVQGAYDGALGTIGQVRLWAVVLTMLVVLALLAVQAAFNRCFKRRINPPLALATVLTVILSVLLSAALDQAQSDYGRQKADAYDSVVALWQSRGAATEMNASESRFLLDSAGPAPASRSGVSDEQTLFDQQAQSTIAQPVDGPQGGLYRTDLDVEAARVAYAANRGALSDAGIEFGGGYLARELANITFSGEQTAAVTALTAYDRFIDDDEQFRSLIDTRASALAYETGTIDRDYATYVAALDNAIAVNEQAFADATARGGQNLGPWLRMPAGWALLTLGLIALGFLPRLREYRRG